MFHQRVDKYWADVFGCPIEQLWRPGCSVSASDMPGAYVLAHDDSCRIAAPASWVAALADATRDLTAADAMTPQLWSDLLPDVTAVLGPSVHAYLDSAHDLPNTGSVMEVDLDALTELRTACPPAEWAEGGFGDDGCFFGLYDRGTLVAAGNLTDWRGVPSDIGLITHPDHRGMGTGCGSAHMPLGSRSQMPASPVIARWPTTAHPAASPVGWVSSSTAPTS